jgi:SAM-dependent methyltransferase
MSKLSRLIRKARGQVKHVSEFRTHAPSWFETRRPLSPTVGTAATLYQSAEQIEKLDPSYSTLLKSPQAIAALQKDTAPIPATADREGYSGDHHLAYWLSGLADLRMVQDLVRDTCFQQVLDFGGASGRFARHIPHAYESAKVTIAEINVNHVEWVEQHLGPSVRAIKVSPYPHFPFEDRSMSLCVGLSVFTHIDSYETGWLSEVHRVLEVGAYAVLTIHSEDTWPLLPTRRDTFENLQRHPEFRNAFRLGTPMPGGRHVYVYNPNSTEYNCDVFMHSDYVRTRWGRLFEVVDVVPRAHHDYQAAVVLRKP